MGVVGDGDRGQATLKAEAERVGRATTGAYYRVALERPSQGPAVVLAMELTVGPVEHDDRHWDSGDFFLASGWAPALQVEKWLSDAAGEVPNSNWARRRAFRHPGPA